MNPVTRGSFFRANLLKHIYVSDDRVDGRKSEHHHPPVSYFINVIIH